MNKMQVPVVIPSYEPDERLMEFLKTIPLDKHYIVIVDDGSGQDYKDKFDEVKEFLKDNGIVLGYDINQGKGHALKTAFKYVLDAIPEAIGVVTADSDGQHDIKAVTETTEALINNPGSLVMGCRCFTGDNVPWKSRVGNLLTVKVLGYVSGVKVSDTQTGLRGIPRKFMEELLSVKGERFEFETEMLVESRGKYPIYEVPIETIYDSVDDHQTHFNAVKDSIRIYKVLGRNFAKFILSSVSSCIIDLLLFTLFCHLLKGQGEAVDTTAGFFVVIKSLLYVSLANILARVISATYNYLINYIVVFKSNESIGKSALKYILLAIIQLTCSTVLVTLGVFILPVIPEIVIKLIVDTILFLISYSIQQNLIFKRK